MSVRQFPEPGEAKKFPFGTNASVAISPLNSGVYEVDITGDDSFSASTNALTVGTGGYRVGVHLDAGEGVVAIPWAQSEGLNAASITTPTVVSFSKIRYDQGAAPSGVSVSLDPNYSGSFVINATVPGDATDAYIFYENGAYDKIGSTFPASVSNPSYDIAASESASFFNLILAYADASGILSLGTAASVAVTQPIGAFATGGTVATSGGYRYHTFTANGTLDVLVSGSMEYLVVAGGGGGSIVVSGRIPGAGGAGGLLSASFNATTGGKSVTVGGGGSRAVGAGSSITGIVSTTGGGRGAEGQTPVTQNGGSGGGGGSYYNTGGTGIAGQGNNGSAGTGSTGGGGGGAGEARNTTAANVNGGDGLNYSTWATATSTGDAGFYAGGGAGTGGTGGDGGGGAPSTAGDANTGGGGGLNGGNGGSGIVIVRYNV